MNNHLVFHGLGWWRPLCVIGMFLTLLANAQVPLLIGHQGRVSVNGTNFTGTGQFRFALVNAGINSARQATANASVVNGFIVGFTITDGGAGYITAPAVHITDNTGTGAIAQAFIANGAISRIDVINAGSGYSSSTTVTIDPPPPNIVYQTYWSNGVNNVTLTVTKGLYSVLLGDTTIPNMAALSADIFTNNNVHLRVWFDDGTNGLQQLSPDQRIAAVGYALMAANVPDGSITGNKIAPGTVTSVSLADGTVSNSKLANNSITVTAGSGLSGGGTAPLGGSVSLGLNLANPNTWTALQTFGSGITVTGQVQATGRLNIGRNHFVDGTANTIAGGYRNTNTADYAVIGGGYQNTVSSNYATIAGGYANTASGNYATIAGGYYNTASNNSATVAGGQNNTGSGVAATVAGGYGNIASGAGAFIGGGGCDGFTYGWNIASGRASVINGGILNRATTNYVTIGGGYQNTASGKSTTVAGGGGNTASGDYATVAGGYQNTASGGSATVAGGEFNTAGGNYSFAAGRSAMATNNGAFVWSSGGFDTYSWGNNTFTVRATGGVRFYTAGGTTNGVQLASGSGSWSSLSDRNAKENFQPVDCRQILERVAALPVATWNYKTQPPTIRHIGPMAQDFAAAFSVGENDHSISTVDADGVALAAIKGLYEELQAQKARNDELEKRIAELERLLANGGK
jgi:hypothetical protein